MKKIIIEIETENDAFYPEPYDEIARILREIAKDVELNKFIKPYDINGNPVGKIKVF